MQRDAVQKYDSTAKQTANTTVTNNKYRKVTRTQTLKESMQESTPIIAYIIEESTHHLCEPVQNSVHTGSLARDVVQHLSDEKVG